MLLKKAQLVNVMQDARRARQEARAVRMELAQSQSVRAQVGFVHPWYSNSG